jgi:hypothetical protein
MTTTEPQQKQHRQEPEHEPEDEAALADLDLPDERAGDVAGGTRGGCDDWNCGSNHNEVLAVTA